MLVGLIRINEIIKAVTFNKTQGTIEAQAAKGTQMQLIGTKAFVLQLRGRCCHCVCSENRARVWKANVNLIVKILS